MNVLFILVTVDVVVIYCHFKTHIVGQTPRLCNLPSKFTSFTTEQTGFGSFGTHRSTRVQHYPNVSGVQYSNTNFPSEISVPFETKTQSLFTEGVLIMSSCTWWKKTLWVPVPTGTWRCCNPGLSSSRQTSVEQLYHESLGSVTQQDTSRLVIS